MGVRQWRDIRRSEIAEAAGVDPSSVTLYEQDKSMPSEGVLVRLAAYLGTTPAYLRYGVVVAGLAATPQRDATEHAKAVEADHAKPTAKRPARRKRA